MRPHLSDRLRTFDVDGVEVELGRGPRGVVNLRVEDDLALARGLGWAHALDRSLQMLLVRTVAQGRLCELVRDDDETFAIDVYIRQMGFARDAERDVANLSPDGRAFAEAYCAGVRAGLARFGLPWELRMLRFAAEPWQPADTLATIKLMSWVGLAQNQEDLERWIVQAVRGGANVAELARLFHPHLDGLTAGIVELLCSLRFARPLVPERARLAAVVPGIRASNSWALAPSRCAGGGPIQCNDPHLECNRLPAVWYEFAATTRAGQRTGISMPGVPGMLMGRTEHLSIGFTYGFMDMVDFFVEECRNGKLRRDDSFVEPRARVETIRRRRHTDCRLTVFESDLGVIETEPGADRLGDGLYLARAWSGHEGGAAASIDALYSVLAARDATQARRVLGRVTISCNWLIADRAGHIAYQQSGLLPVRAHSGLFPLPAWPAENRWLGVHPPEQLAFVEDPDEGFLITANGDHNQERKPLSINAPMASYREDRIRELLAQRERHTLDDMKRIQADLHSREADAFLELFGDAIPDGEAGRVLRAWDRRYDTGSRGAYVFEQVHGALLRRVFGALFGLELWDAAVAETELLAVHYGFFHRAILDGSALGEDDGARRGLVHEVLAETCARVERDGIKTLGQSRPIRMNHLLLGGRLRWLGFDHGPIELEGGRATVTQGGVFRSQGRLTTFAPSYRYVADLSQRAVHTSLAGGPSDRRFSGLYRNEIAAWLARDYKTLTAPEPRGNASMPP